MRNLSKKNYSADVTIFLKLIFHRFYFVGIAAITGIIGVFSTALLVAVISQKLELTRSEKYVHNFVASIQLSKAHKDQSANVVKYGWKVWYLKRKGKNMFIQYVQAQRKLLTSIHYVRKIRQQQ